MPIAVGTVGGALKSHPVYKMAMSLLGNPSAQDLAQIIVAVGLAQNFAALRAAFDAAGLGYQDITENEILANLII